MTILAQVPDDQITHMLDLLTAIRPARSPHGLEWTHSVEWGTL